MKNIFAAKIKYYIQDVQSVTCLFSLLVKNTNNNSLRKMITVNDFTPFIICLVSQISPLASNKYQQNNDINVRICSTLWLKGIKMRAKISINR